MNFRLLSLLICLFFAFTAPAQNSVYDQLSPGYLTFGINGGLSYQTSDVKARFNGYGLGLTLGKNLYYHPASPFTADIRARFLYARQYGLDGAPSSDIGQNIGLNGSLNLDYLHYPPQYDVTGGLVYHNYKTTLGELAAEGVLSWNTNRLGPGLFFSLYGGVGIDYFLTRIDQADANGSPYYEGYSSLGELTVGKARRELKNSILDGSYETIPDNLPSRGAPGIVPSLGFEAGIQLTPRFAVSLGHRITFTGNNLLDGHQWEDSRGDWYHYTNLGLHWTLTPVRKVRGKTPQISITYPGQNPFTSSNSNGMVKARITGVQSAADVVCTVNGSMMPFDFYAGDFAVSFPLVPGRNDVNIQASNAYGRDLESVQIYFQTGTGITPPPSPRPNPAPPRPNPPPAPAPNPTPNPKPSPSPSPRPTPGPVVMKPQVQITQPAADPFTSSSAATTIQATVKNVSSSSDIRFTLNGVQQSKFSFSGTSFQATVTLKSGTNKVEIEAGNSAGSAKDQVTITYSNPPPPPPPPPMPPAVSINQPADQAIVAEPSVELRATMKNISQKNQITFLVNNNTTTAFSYSNGQFQATAPLRAGNNTILIRVQNQDGKAEDGIQVTYRIPPPPVPKPDVTFLQPAKPGAGAQKTPYEVKARVGQVAGPGQITFKVNGKDMKGFQFDPKTGQFSANIDLLEGRNDLEISATNESGSAVARSNVSYRKPPVISPGNKPVVTITSITQPASNPLNPNVASSTLEATIANVTRKQEISLTINGAPVNDFSFDARSGLLTTTLLLPRGSNTIVLKATTRVGSDEEQRTIDF